MRWEHHSVRFGARGSSFDWEKFEDVLQRRGEEGWELVTVETLVSHGSTSVLLLCFKRPLSR